MKNHTCWCEQVGNYREANGKGDLQDLCAKTTEFFLVVPWSVTADEWSLRMQGCDEGMHFFDECVYSPRIGNASLHCRWFGENRKVTKPCLFARVLTGLL